MTPRSQVMQQLRVFGAASQGMENDAAVDTTALGRGHFADHNPSHCGRLPPRVSRKVLREWVRTFINVRLANPERIWATRELPRWSIIQTFPA